MARDRNGRSTSRTRRGRSSQDEDQNKEQTQEPVESNLREGNAFNGGRMGRDSRLTPWNRDKDKAPQQEDAPEETTNDTIVLARLKGLVDGSVSISDNSITMNDPDGNAIQEIQIKNNANLDNEIDTLRLSLVDEYDIPDSSWNNILSIIEEAFGISLNAHKMAVEAPTIAKDFAATAIPEGMVFEPYKPDTINGFPADADINMDAISLIHSQEELQQTIDRMLEPLPEHGTINMDDINAVKNSLENGTITKEDIKQAIKASPVDADKQSAIDAIDNLDLDTINGYPANAAINMDAFDEDVPSADVINHVCGCLCSAGKGGQQISVGEHEPIVTHSVIRIVDNQIVHEAANAPPQVEQDQYNPMIP